MILKVIRNRRTKKPVKVKNRINYLLKNAKWTNRDPVEFVNLIKNNFKDEKTIHIVFSFDENLSPKEYYREILLEFLEEKFQEHEYFIAEHLEKRQQGYMTAFHVVLSRNLKNNKLVHLNNKEFYQLRQEWHTYIEKYLKQEQKIKIQNWKKEYGTKKKIGLEPWQKKEYLKLKEEINNAESVRSFKAVARAIADKIVEEINNINKIEEIINIINLYNADITHERAKRDRYYLVFEFRGRKHKIRLNRLKNKESIEKIIEVMQDEQFERTTFENQARERQSIQRDRELERGKTEDIARDRGTEHEERGAIAPHQEPEPEPARDRDTGRIPRRLVLVSSDIVNRDRDFIFSSEIEIEEEKSKLDIEFWQEYREIKKLYKELNEELSKEFEELRAKNLEISKYYEVLGKAFGAFEKRKNVKPYLDFIKKGTYAFTHLQKTGNPFIDLIFALLSLFFTSLETSVRIVDNIYINLNANSINNAKKDIDILKGYKEEIKAKLSELQDKKQEIKNKLQEHQQQKRKRKYSSPSSPSL